MRAQGSGGEAISEDNKLVLSQMGLQHVGRDTGFCSTNVTFHHLLISAYVSRLGPLPVEHLRSLAATLVLRPVVPHVVDALPLLSPQGDCEVTIRLHPGVRTRLFPALHWQQRLAGGW